ncbi:MAG: flagellar basal body P-ring formation chaperone FlgA [Nitrospinaceae bacterium]
MNGNRIKLTFLVFTMVPWLLGGGLALAGNPEKSQILPRGVMEDQARQFLINELSWNEEDVAISVRYNDKDLRLPSGPLGLEYRLVGRRNALGRVPLSLIIRVNNEVQKKVWLEGRVEAYQEVVRTTRPLPRDHVLHPGDVQIVRIKSSRPLRNVVMDLQSVIGYQTLRPLGMGQTLSTHMVKRVPLVKRGDRILLVAERGRLRITAPGVAKENGFRDSMVRVENLQTRKIIYGTVQNSKTVKVEF